MVFVQVATGYINSCGVRFDGSVECWGDNSSYQSAVPEGRFTQISLNLPYILNIMVVVV